MESTLPHHPTSNPSTTSTTATTTADTTATSLSTTALHADESFKHASADVAPPMHVSTTFRYSSDPSALVSASELPDTLFADPIINDDSHVYSRETAPNTARLEATLSALLHGRSVTYSSGLAAIHAVLVLLNPKHIAIGDGYHGTHGVIGVHTRLTGLKVLPLDCATDELERGDVIHVESPLNPTGEAVNIAAYAQKAHDRGAYLVVDSTFGPPPLQDPLALGADIVMHSGTKYLGGHSDMLCGVLAVAEPHAQTWCPELLQQRTYLGNVMGSFEGWLGLRSVRTLELRVRRQSENALALVRWLSSAIQEDDEDDDGDEKKGSGTVGKVVRSVSHASLQRDPWVQTQMPGGYGPVFAVVMKTELMARTLPSLLTLFTHATSLGGVESLIEWRAMSDSTCDRKLLRVSVGIEAWLDLKADLERGFEALVKTQES